MKNFLVKWFINIIALFIIIHTVAGVSAESWQIVIVAALVLGLLNAFLRPVVVMLTLPFNILTLGFLTLIINGFMFYLAAKLVRGFTVSGFWNAFWAALIFSIISFILNMLFSPKINISVKTAKYKDVIDTTGVVLKDE